MCGRFTLKTAAALWVQELFPGLQLLDVPPDAPRYNIAPTQSILSILQTHPQSELRVVPTRWGLVPAWANDLSMGAKMINARSETVAEKPSFRSAFVHRRCLIVADGYYEWPKGTGDGKQPYWIHRPDEKPFLMAGLYEINKHVIPNHVLISSTILTTAANASMQHLHDRMPIIIHPSDALSWLNPEKAQSSEVSPMMRSAEEDYFVAEPVSRHVNNVRNEDSTCISRIQTLF